MMHDEFMEIAGYEVSYEDYKNYIEPMYMAVPETVTKAEFVKMIDKKRFALPTEKEMIKEMKKIVNHLYEIWGHRTDYEAEAELDKIAKKYAERFWGIDWNRDTETFVYFHREYQYGGHRGCSLPVELVIGRGYTEYKRIKLIKMQ